MIPLATDYEAVATKWVPILTPILTPALLAILGFFGRRILKSIKKLVNDRLDKALERIDDLESIIASGNGYHRKTDKAETTAHALRSHPSRRKGDKQ